MKCFGAGQKTDGAVFGVAGGSSANLREGEKVNHKKIQEMKDFAKDIREMADVTEHYTDILENPESTDKEKAEAHKRYLEALAILDI